jgi:tetratricopeptide (TPR) repeat protein
VKREMGATQTNLADALRDMGEYEAARVAYEASLAIIEKLDDQRSVGVINGQLGSVALKEKNFAEAEMRYDAALTTFQTLNEPGSEAIVLHQLGRVYEETKAWEPAERAYRAAAQIKEAQGNLAGAAQTWNQLAIVCEKSGKPKEAEAWYRKEIEADRRIGNDKEIAADLSNLANLLQTQANRLSEARQLAEEALTIRFTLDPSASEIWETYNILAKICTQQKEPASAQEYRRLSHHSYAAFAGARYELQRWEDRIQVIVAAMNDAEVRQQVEEAFPQWPPSFATTIQRIWAGVREEEELCDELDFQEGAIVVEILKRSQESH